jgi:LDH2 family malate/lactate/ureidoglycolate dehydrogenase
MWANASSAEDVAALVSPDELRRFIRGLFETLGTPAPRAEIVTDVLVEADAMGVRSHGTEYNVFNIYLPGIRDGSIRTNPDIRLLRDEGATALVDGDRGLGQIVGHHAMNLALARAAVHGVGVVAVNNSTHFGAAGYFARMAARANMIGIALTNAAPRTLPTFGTTAMLGTNPIAFAAPAPDGVLNVDFATSTVCGTRVIATERDGDTVRPSWAGGEGDNAAVPAALRLLPLGGAGTEDGGHKGYGLALMVDVLAGLLSGAGHSALLHRPIVGHFFLAIDVSRFQAIEGFMAGERAMADDLRKAPANAGEAVLVPGDLEAECRAYADRVGIPMRLVSVERFDQLASEYRVAPLRWSRCERPDRSRLS